MLLFYVDESGVAGGSRAVSGRGRYFSLAAVGIRDSSRATLGAALRAVRVKYFGEAAATDRWAETELKSRYIAAAQTPSEARPPAPYAVFEDKAKYANLVNDLRKVLARFRPQVIAVVIDKASLSPAESPVAVAYAKLYERVALTLQHVNVGESALFIADRQDEHEAAFTSGAVHAARERHASRGSLRPDFSLIVDRPLWLDPGVSTWDREIIQLADLVALPAREWAARDVPPAEAHFLWTSFRPLFAVHWNEATPQKGGLVIFPPPAKYPAV